MRLGLLALAVGAATLSVIAPGAASGAVDARLSVGGVSSALTRALRIGYPSDSTVHFEVTLATRHTAALERLLAGVTTPGTSTYRHYLARGAFQSRFGATSASTASLRTYLTGAGLGSVRLMADGLALAVTGSAGAAARAFDTKFGTYRSTRGATFIANATPMTLPRALASEVTGVTGFDGPSPLSSDRTLLGHGLAPTPRVVTPLATTGPVPSPVCANQIATAYGASSPAGYRADQIAAAYGLDPLYATGDLGAGKTIAVVEFSNFSTTDISEYALCYGIAPNVVAMPVDGGPSQNQPADEAEAELDIEDVIGLAPAASVLVYEGSTASSNDAADDVYAAAVDQDRAQVITTSWGTCEAASSSSSLRKENTIFEQAALQGQTVIAASGDSGSEDCVGSLKGKASAQLSVDDPASQPFVTGVGGTTLSIAPTRSEVVWNDGESAAISGAGGGGVSSIWPMPAYQADTPPSLDVVSPASSGSCGSATECREVPDLSANAGAPYAIYCTLGLTYCARGGWTGVGGTSAAAPTVAALILLADASSACTTIGSIGFANPALYRTASGPGYSTALNDVTTGENDYTGDHGGDYPAGIGYDLASGLGSPDGGSGSDAGLVTPLCSPIVEQAVAATSGVRAPKIAKLVPDTGSSKTATSVTITGTDFAAARSVTVGDTVLTGAAFTVISNTEIKVTVPPSTGRVHVAVTGPSGTTTPDRRNVFAFLARPTIIRLGPTGGPDVGGTTVTIIGTGFRAVRAVRFGGARAVSFTVRSPSRIVATAPPGRGSDHVVVVTAGGRSVRTASNIYSYS